MRILFLSRWFPYPADNGSKIRIFNLIRQLASRHEVDLVSFVDETPAESHLAELKRYCRNIDTTRYQPFQPDSLRARLAYFSWRPRWMVETHSRKMQRLIQRSGRERSVDAVIASQIDMAPYALVLPHLPRLFEEVELTGQAEWLAGHNGAAPRRLRNRLTWWKHARYVAHLLRAFDGCTVVSTQERDFLLRVMPGYAPIEIVPNGVDVSYYADDFGPPEPDTLVYSGALTYDANYLAMDFFVRQVLPIIRAERPQVRLLITGKTDGIPPGRLPRAPGVVYTGYVDDIRPTVARSWLSIAPLQHGGGTRLKILEALALGTPVVSTSKGAEGLDLLPERDLLIADRAARFAEAVLRILRDAALRSELGRQGRHTVATRYDWPDIGRRLCDFVERIATQEKPC